MENADKDETSNSSDKPYAAPEWWEERTPLHGTEKDTVFFQSSHLQLISM